MMHLFPTATTGDYWDYQSNRRTPARQSKINYNVHRTGDADVTRVSRFYMTSAHGERRAHGRGGRKQAWGEAALINCFLSLFIPVMFEIFQDAEQLVKRILHPESVWFCATFFSSLGSWLRYLPSAGSGRCSCDQSWLQLLWFSDCYLFRVGTQKFARRPPPCAAC